MIRRLIAWLLGAPPSRDWALAPDWAEPTTPPPGRPGMSPPDTVSARELERLADRVDGLAVRLAHLESDPVRIERCDGLCPGDDCPACQATADMAAELQRLATRVEVLEIALSVERVKDRAAGGRSREVGSVNCPHPYKAAFASRREAQMVLRKLARHRRIGLHVYRCRCGMYHHGRLIRRPIVAWRSQP